MKIEFCDLVRQYSDLRNKIDSAIQKVLIHGKFIGGPEIEELEAKCAAFTNSKYAIAVSSGTDALVLSLMAYNIGEGDYVMTTPFTFAATAESISFLGAKPVFIDIDEESYNISPEKILEFLRNPVDKSTGQRIPLEKIKCVIPVDLFGQPADYATIRSIAKEYNFFILEDGAQSFGADYGGNKSCSLGDISITSFFPAKPLGCYGDGGMIFTNNKDIADKIKMLRNHGQSEKYTHKIIGLNARMDTIQAAILLAKFDSFINQDISNRRLIASQYHKNLIHLAKTKKIILPQASEQSVYAQFCIQTENRDQFATFLKENGIPTAIHYPKSLHLQEAFQYLGYVKGDFPISERISKRIISLPMDALKTKEELKYICDKIISFHS